VILRAKEEGMERDEIEGRMSVRCDSSFCVVFDFCSD